MKKLENLWSNHYSKCVFVAYWLFGMCNNFPYVIMLSAAHDILSRNETSKDNISHNNNNTNKYDCNKLSTGTILLADTLPGVIIVIIGRFI